MLLPNQLNRANKIKKDSIAFRIDNDIVLEFRTLCRQYKFNQSDIIKNAMKLAINEIKEAKNEK